MAFDINGSTFVCSRCGKAYGRRKGYFPVSYAALYKGIGYITICKECIELMYAGYLSEYGNQKDAVRQTCRKLDLYWSESVYNTVEKTTTQHTVMIGYIAKISSSKYSGKSYDDTLISEGTIRSWDSHSTCIADPLPKQEVSSESSEPDIPESVMLFWGTGYTPQMYLELEQRREYWMSKIAEEQGRDPDSVEVNAGTEALIRQLCNLELDINRDRASGKSIDKNVNTLNTLLKSLGFNTNSRKGDESDEAMADTPLGVWLWRYENKRPLPELDEEFKDVNRIRRYISIWVKGHLAKMMGVKNSYSKMYEDEIERLRVEKPECDAEDDEDFLYDVLTPGDVDDKI